MPDTPFPIFGTTDIPLVGRAAILQKLVAALSKPVPDNLQVVGPRFAGKTVLLRALGSRLRGAESPFSAVVYWDLGHQTPATDDEFMRQFARELSGALQEHHPDYATYLKDATGSAYPEIAEVLDSMKDEGAKVLVIMDGFDRPLSNGQLTRNLWDQLRELALKPSLRLVTGSRRTLRELIRNPEAQTSDFWNVFNSSPVRVRCFDEDDIAAALSCVHNLQFADGARTELWNATNGYPVLILSVLNAACGANAGEVVTQAAMLAACNNAYPTVRETIGALWDGCSSSMQDLMRQVLTMGVVAVSAPNRADADALAELGFVRLAANKIQKPSRLVQSYLEERPGEGSSLAYLFGSPAAYERNLKGVLERRIAQIANIDPTLKRYLEHGIDDLPDHPDVFLSNIRGIVNQTFELIWAAEIPDRRIPSGWMSVWKRNGERRVDEWETTFPQGVHRVRLLNLMTGTDKSVSCSKYVTRTTYVLANAAHAFGDFGQHQEGAPVHVDAAYAAFHLCIELAAALARELPRA